MMKLRCHVARGVTMGTALVICTSVLSCRREDGSIGYFDNSIAMIVAAIQSS